MKNTIKIFKRMSLGLVLTIMTITALGQCDSRDYGYDLEVSPRFLDNIILYQDKDTAEFVSCGTGTLQKKNITFVHGLGGSANSWGKQAVWTGQYYQTAKTVVNYDANLQSSFDYVADNLLEPQLREGSEQVTTNFPTRCVKNDFVIAHSQGGIAARYLDWQWDVNTSGDFGTRSFYGLVTFGTPNGGADVALTKTEHAAFIQKVISSVLLYDKVGSKVYDLTDKYGFLLAKSASDILAPIDSLIKNSLAPIMLGGIHTPTLDEMKPNSPTMNSLTNHKSRLRKVAFYGTEDAPECWKLMSMLSDTATEDYPIWRAIKDNGMQDKMESVRADHISSISENQRKIRKLRAQSRRPVLGLFSFNAGNKMMVLNDNIDSRQSTIDFLNNASTSWRYLIGSYHRDSMETKTVTKYIVKWDEKYAWLSKWFHQERSFYSYSEAASYSATRHGQVYQIKNNHIATVQEYRQVQKLFPSDGLILVRSQIAFPGVGKRIALMEHDNHFQLRNSPEAKDRFEELYNGDHDLFFKTVEK